MIWFFITYAISGSLVLILSMFIFLAIKSKDEYKKYLKYHNISFWKYFFSVYLKTID